VQLPSGTTANLRDCASHNQIVRVVGDGGNLLVSTDSGLTWALNDTGTSVDLVSIDVHSATQWWIGGAEGTVLVSTNGGTDWMDRSAPTDVTLHLFSRSGGISWAVGDMGTIYKSTNQGSHWNAQTSGTANALHDGEGFGSGPAHAVGDAGTILRSANGVDWTVIDSGVSADLRAYVEPNIRLVAGSGGTILKSTDGGLTWSQKDSGVAEDLHALDTSGANGNHVVAVGAGGTAIKSTDAGETWCALNTGTSADLYAAEFATQTVITLFGEGGLILRTENGGGTCLFAAAAPAPAAPRPGGELSLRRNPARTYTILSLRSAGSQHVSLRLVDAQGRSVRTYPGAHLEGGLPQVVRLDLRGLVSGVYTLVAEGEEFRRSGKLLVLR
jgi:photosystem II stability/assembly factor-like uncharacterized protein